LLLYQIDGGQIGEIYLHVLVVGLGLREFVDFGLRILEERARVHRMN